MIDQKMIINYRSIRLSIDYYLNFPEQKFWTKINFVLILEFLFLYFFQKSKLFTFYNIIFIDYVTVKF